MKLAVIGSRTFADKVLLYGILDKNLDKIELIISGGAAGADTLAQEWAQERGVPYLVYPARWRDLAGKYDRGAGFRRNIQIIKACDRVLCFWDGKSRGTQHSIDLSKQYDKPCRIVQFEPTPIPARTQPKGAQKVAVENPCAEVPLNPEPMSGLPECCCHLHELAQDAENQAQAEAEAEVKSQGQTIPTPTQTGSSSQYASEADF